MTRAYLSVGSNVDRRRHIGNAIVTLAARFGTLELSRVYESEAVGFDGDPFLNLALAFDTDMSPQELVRVLREIEATEGRRREGPRFSDRSLDLDLLLYGDTVLDEPGLRLPRDEILTNAFVLLPLSELAGERLHPLARRSFAELWSGFDDSSQRLWPVAFDWPVGVDLEQHPQ